ncbi:MAG: Cof-type HAD-IIB family hydrolase [Actinobacteria bacterium]|nr:Cof-type HAD-IIB family hydrolase [Actinomycetota bacterium]
MTVPPRLPDGVVAGGRFERWEPARPAYLVADVDGTVVRPDGVTPEGLEALVADLQAAGVRVGLATGRMRPSVSDLWQRLGAAGPHVLHNGAEVFGDGAIVATWPLTRDEVGALIDLAHRRDVYLEVYVEHGFYVTDDRAPERDHWPMLGHDPLGFVDDLPDGSVFPKATFALTAPAETHFLDDIEALGLIAGPAQSPQTPHLHYVNANNPAADKGRAVTHAAAHLGVELAAVVAVGDGANDLSMFGVVGTAIAMGQSAPAIIAAAHLVVPDAADDGVMTALEAVRALCRAGGA